MRHAPEVAIGREPRAMLEQLAYGDRILVAAGELGEIRDDGRVELDAPFVEEDHDGGGGADDLRERREIIDGLGGRDSAAGVDPVHVAESLLPHGSALAADDDRGAGESARLDAARHHAID